MSNSLFFVPEANDLAGGAELPIVCDPLTLYMFCAPSDGAAAIELCSQKVAKKCATRPVILASCAID
jgi:acetyl-CoA acetyltransferase